MSEKLVFISSISHPNGPLGRFKDITTKCGPSNVLNAFSFLSTQFLKFLTSQQQSNLYRIYAVTYPAILQQKDPARTAEARRRWSW